MIEITMEESPYGDSGTVYKGMLGMITHWISQLESFRGQNKTPEDREYLEADLRGYRAVLDTGSQVIAEAFIKAKHDARVAGKCFKNNEAVVEHLKAVGKWTT